ncbi:MAG: hypothetical protein ACK5Y2_10110 [Bdellovibrionales bacterium]
MKIVIVEALNLVEGYAKLAQGTQSGLTPLEFSPHAKGARIVFKTESAKAPPLGSAEVFEVTESVLKAYLGLGGAQLLEKVMILQDARLGRLLEVTQKLENLGATILELRSLRSNPEINYTIATCQDATSFSDLLKDVQHVVLDSKNPAFSDFLGFSVG